MIEIIIVLIIYGIVKFIRPNNKNLSLSKFFSSTIFKTIIVVYIIFYLFKSGCNSLVDGLENVIQIEKTDKKKWNPSECECISIFNDYDGHQSSWIDKNFCIDKYIIPKNASNNNKYVPNINHCFKKAFDDSWGLPSYYSYDDVLENIVSRASMCDCRKGK